MEDHDMSSRACNEDGYLTKNSGCGCLVFLIIFAVYILWIIVEGVLKWLF